MRVSLGERTLATALLVPTAIVVIVLAGLQYRWSNQVSTATSVRLADSLQMSMMNWHLNFFRDLSDISFRLRIDSATVGTAELADLSRRFQAWHSSAQYPDLVSGLYVVSGGGGALPALRFDPSTRRFEMTRQPPELEGLRRDLQQTEGTPAGSATLYYTGAELEGWQFDPRLPALVHPISAAADVFGSPTRARSDASAWLILELSADAIRTRIFPELSNRYFAGVDGLDYQVAVVTETRPPRVLYSSEPEFRGQDPADADGRLSLFGRPIDKTSNSPLSVFHKPSDNTGLSASIGMSWFPLVRNIAADEDWQLIVQHRRGGPLAAFVADVHRRDLAVSFGVLLLLVVSMTMWIIVSNRAQRLARLQMDFVTAVSHELRTPLTIISSAADNITQGFVHEKQQVAQYGAVIGNQARRLSELVEQVLLFASTQEAPHRYVLRPVDISEVIDSTLTADAGLIQAWDVIVERDIEPNLPLVMGDPLAVSQCLQNLITNALKYGNLRRWLGIRATFAKSGNEIQISVSDQGLGIAASDLPHIFKPFYRSPSVAAAQIHGTGLGLTVARSIAEAMKGQLTVTTNPGSGSTFTLHIPCAAEGSVPVDTLADHVVAQS
jgi:signal transduction histidine kinase